jgi:hypothetical protein
MKPVTRFFALMLCLMMMAAVVPVSASPEKEVPAWPATETRVEQYASFPLPLDQYAVPAGGETRPLMERIMERAKQDPFNVWATVIFVCAILHTFAAGMFQSMAHHAEETYHQEWHATGAAENRGSGGGVCDVGDSAAGGGDLVSRVGGCEVVCEPGL